MMLTTIAASALLAQLTVCHKNELCGLCSVDDAGQFTKSAQ